jgi:hypothetical protein
VPPQKGHPRRFRVIHAAQPGANRCVDHRGDRTQISKSCAPLLAGHSPWWCRVFVDARGRKDSDALRHWPSQFGVAGESAGHRRLRRPGARSRGEGGKGRPWPARRELLPAGPDRSLASRAGSAEGRRLSEEGAAAARHKAASASGAGKDQLQSRAAAVSTPVWGAAPEPLRRSVARGASAARQHRGLLAVAAGVVIAGYLAIRWWGKR